jgi:hypothetical protein
MRTSLITAGLALFASAAVAQPAPPRDMKERTADIATRYLDVWSSDAASSVAGVPYIYGDRVRFYGRDMTQGDLVAEKRRVLRQWPSRRYVHRPGSMRVQCNEARLRCVASSIIDYQATNPTRGTSKRGSARFDLGVSFAGPKPVILFEGGSLGRRRV